MLCLYLKYRTPMLEEKKNCFKYALRFCHTALLKLNFKKHNTKIVVYSVYSTAKAESDLKSGN